MNAVETIDPPMMRAVLPPAVVLVESDFAVPPTPLLPGEEGTIARAGALRRDEYARGRQCARTALAAFGIQGFAVKAGICREPVWPDGLVGSITHCEGYCAAAVAHADCFAGLGIDCEPHRPLPAGVCRSIYRDEELRDLTTDGTVCWDKVIFSAKEAAFKAVFPITRNWIDFLDVVVQIDTERRVFHVTAVHARVREAAPLSRLMGRFRVSPSMIYTAAFVTR